MTHGDRSPTRDILPGRGSSLGQQHSNYRHRDLAKNRKKKRLVVAAAEQSEATQAVQREKAQLRDEEVKSRANKVNKGSKAKVEKAESLGMLRSSYRS